MRWDVSVESLNVERPCPKCRLSFSILLNDMKKWSLVSAERGGHWLFMITHLIQCLSLVYV